MSARPKGRRPGDSGTREAILDAARELFAEVGYDRASMRAVAARAGVDPALIHHYFGTKDRLLASALQLPVDPEVLLAGVADHPERAGAEIVRRGLMLWDGNPEARDRMVGLMRAALSHDQAAAAMRDLLAGSVLATLELVVRDETAPLRAGLIGTQLGGLMLGRYVLRIPAVAGASAESLVAAVGPAIQHYVTGAIVPADVDQPA